MDDCKVYGVVALKGGVGKTTLVANLGASLSADFDKKVLLVDANFSTPHLGLHLGVIDPEFTLHHVLNDDHSIYESIYQHALGFHIIPGRLAPFEVDPLALKEKLEPLKKIYDVIIIDSSPSLNDEMYATMAASDELLVVSSPDYPTLSSTLYAIDVADKKDTEVRGIVINKVHKKKFELSSRDIASASDVKVLAAVPNSVKVLAALAKMAPVVSVSPRHDVSIAYKKLAGSLVGEKYGTFSRLKRRMAKK
jgi:septum site-determining protein MinD